LGVADWSASARVSNQYNNCIIKIWYEKDILFKKGEYIMKKYLRNILYGFLAWFIPFAASLF
jgi:hypothetical protein